MFQSCPKFGLLSYSTFNLGDEIQSLAAQRFLPHVDHYVDRETLDEFHSVDSVPLKLIMNGWYCHRADKWPPSPDIDPLLISMHLSDCPGNGSGLRCREVFARTPKVLQYLQEHGPVGARDHSTQELLGSWGIDSYFSGCLTLTLERAAIAREHDLIVLCDVPKAVAARAEVYAKGRQLHQLVHRDSNTVGIEARLDRAKALLNLYAQAACVVTTRLHCALPCLAMGTPVLLIDMAADSYRFTGLIDLLHHCSVAEFVSGELGYDLADPPQNPTGHLLLRKALVERVIAFTKETTPSLPRSL